MVGHEHPRVRVGRRWAHRHPLLRRARGHRDPDRVPQPARLPAHLRPPPRQPPRARGLRHVRRPQRQQARNHPEHEAPPRCRAGQATGVRVGRRRQRELCAQSHARLRHGLRHARGRSSRHRDGERVPPGPDRSPPRLSRVRRAGRRAVRLQLPHRLARPRTARSLRHHHRLAGTAVRRHRARRRAPVPRAHRPGRVSRPLAGGGGGMVAVAMAARLRGQRERAHARRQPLRPRRSARCLPVRG